MAIQDYTYALTEFPNQAANAGSLSLEIEAKQTLTIALAAQGVSVDATNAVLWFKSPLGTDDLAALDEVVAAHQGDPVPGDPQLVEVSNQPLVRSDGTLYAVPKAASFGLEMCDRDFKLICGTYDTKALHTVSNGANGSVTYVSARAGTHGNDHTIEVKTGATGSGNEDRALAVARVGEDITVTFGTDGSGNSVTPTATAVANLINTDYDVALHHMNAVASGDGSGTVATVAKTALVGGTNPSCEDLYIDTSTLEEESWGELSLIGVYKDEGTGTVVECDDQSDADTNAILSVWEYTAIHPYTHDLLKYEIRDGYLVVDSSLPANEAWDHRAYAIGAPLIAGNLGGTIRLFDGYLGPAPNGVIDSKSPQTSVMDPALGPGTSSIRLYIYYPAGSKLKHVLRLVTYRAPGTF